MHESHQPCTGSWPPAVPPGVRIYAVGDVHGRDDLLAALLERIDQDRAARPIPWAQVVFLGDYVDRGPDSLRVVERLLGGPGPQATDSRLEWICLRGNHEEMLIRFLQDYQTAQGWLCNGGMETLRSYIGSVCHDLDSDMAALHLLFSRALPPTHVRFLARLPLWHVVGDYFFVHAGIRPGQPLDRQNPRDLLWIRHDFLRDDRDHGKIIIHGHTITDAPDVRSNRIGLDTGAYDSHRLSCLVLEGTERRFLSA